MSTDLTNFSKHTHRGRVTPVESAACGALGCSQGESLYRVTVDGAGSRVACEQHIDDVREKLEEEA